MYKGYHLQEWTESGANQKALFHVNHEPNPHFVCYRNQEEVDRWIGDNDDDGRRSRMPSIRYPNETNAETRREGRTRTRKTKKEKNEEEVIDGTEAKNQKQKQILRWGGERKVGSTEINSASQLQSSCYPILQASTPRSDQQNTLLREMLPPRHRPPWPHSRPRIPKPLQCGRDIPTVPYPLMTRVLLEMVRQLPQYIVVIRKTPADVAAEHGAAYNRGLAAIV